MKTKSAVLWVFYNALTISIGLSSGTVFSAEVSSKSSGGEIYFKGEIVKGDYEKVEKAVRSKKGSKHVIELVLDSPGGNVVEAMKIGDLLSEARIKTRIVGELNLGILLKSSEAYVGPQCSSACVFIFLGGVDRTPTFYNKVVNGDESNPSLVSTIGIHRPYFQEEYYDGLGSGDVELTYEFLTEKTRQYLLSKGASENLVDRMFRVSSVDIVFLTNDEFNEDIGVRKPFMQEMLIAKCYTDDLKSIESKISKDEFRERFSKCVDSFFVKEQQSNISKIFK